MDGVPGASGNEQADSRAAWCKAPHARRTWAPATDSVLAGQENPASTRQAVLRRAHDVLKLSVVLAQPACEGRRAGLRSRLPGLRPAPEPRRRGVSWTDYSAIWT